MLYFFCLFFNIFKLLSFFKIVFIYWFLAVLGLHCCMGFYLVAGSGDYSLVAVCSLLIVVNSPVTKHRLQGTWASVVVAPGSQSTGSIGVVHGLSCSVACVIFPDQGSNPCLLHWQTNSLPLSHWGSPCPLPDLTSLSMIISSSIYVAANGIISFIFMTE